MIAKSKSQKSLAKKETLETLSELILKWLPEWDQKRPLSNIIRGRLDTCRKVARKEISDLKTLLQYLPEDQLEQIFTWKELEGLIRALFNVKKENLEKDEKKASDQRKRILRLFFCTLQVMGSWNNAEALARDTLWTLKEAGLNEAFLDIIGLKALYIEGYALDHYVRSR